MKPVTPMGGPNLDHLEDDRALNHSTTLRAQSRQAQQSAYIPHQSSVWNINTHTQVNEPVNFSDRLSHFYRKYNKAILDMIAIDKEKERLAAENAQIEDLIQQYVNGTKVTKDTLLGDNPLFVVNGR